MGEAEDDEDESLLNCSNCFFAPLNEVRPDDTELLVSRVLDVLPPVAPKIVPVMRLLLLGAELRDVGGDDEEEEELEELTVAKGDVVAAVVAPDEAVFVEVIDGAFAFVVTVVVLLDDGDKDASDEIDEVELDEDEDARLLDFDFLVLVEEIVVMVGEGCKGFDFDFLGVVVVEPVVELNNKELLAAVKPPLLLLVLLFEEEDFEEDFFGVVPLPGECFSLDFLPVEGENSIELW